MKTIGSLNLILHAHLPFVRHPEYPRFLEEAWLYEAINETYLPLLRVFNRLSAEKIPFKLSFSLSPTLLAMLSDPLLQNRYVEQVDRLLELTDKEMERTQSDPQLHRVVQLYLDLLLLNKQEFLHLYNKNIVTAFKELEKSGHLELMTTAATHAFLPYYQEFPASVEAQVKTAIDSHYFYFGHAPKGFWLPECGYYPGLEEVLAEHDIRYFISSAHGLLFAENPPSANVYAPVVCKNNVAVFPRDIASSQAVWGEENGYPGDPDYRDFYRDVGFDLPLDYIRPYIEDGIRVNTGLKYYRVTSKTSDDKKVYDPDAASLKVLEHAKNFIYQRRRQLKAAHEKYGVTPLINAPFDAELFGHWWFEGPQFIEAVIRKIAAEPDIALSTPSDFLETHSDFEQTDPVFSSWGINGFGEVWLDGSNDWIYLLIHGALEQMQDLAERFPEETGLRERVLNQAAREILLAQASDWPFIMYTGTAVQYATRRVKEHIANFNRIYTNFSHLEMDTEWVTDLEKKDNLFPFIDYRLFRKKQKPS